MVMDVDGSSVVFAVPDVEVVSLPLLVDVEPFEAVVEAGPVVDGLVEFPPSPPTMWKGVENWNLTGSASSVICRP